MKILLAQEALLFDEAAHRSFDQNTSFISEDRGGDNKDMGLLGVFGCSMAEASCTKIVFNGETLYWSEQIV